METKKLHVVVLAAALCSLLLLGALNMASAGANLEAIEPPGCNTNNFNLTITREPTVAHNGDTILYSVQACNLPVTEPGKSTCAITGVVITFYPPGLNGLPSAVPLPPIEPGEDFDVGECKDYPPIPWVVNLNPGVTTAQARVDWTGNLEDAPNPPGDPQSGSKTVTISVIDIDVTKTADTEISKAGDTVTYTICVENTGGVTLRNITVVDDHLGDLSDSFADSLAPGASECHDFEYVVQPGDDDPLVNTVEARGTYVEPGETEVTVTDTDDAIIDLVHPSIEVTKEADVEVSKVGDTVTYTICVENTSPDVTLENITVVDDHLGDLSDSFADSLEPGESECHDFRYVVQPDDDDPLVNEVVVHSNPVDLPNDITDSDTEEVDLVHPCLGGSKAANTEISKVGDTVIYTICVSNCSADIALENITVVDSLLGDLSGSFADSLGTGGSECHDFPYVVQPGDPDPLPNTVQIDANPEGLPNQLHYETTISVDLVHPEIDVTKECSPSVATIGETVDYEICLHNTGDVALENITVVDTLLGDLSDSFADSLDLGESECHTFPREVQPGDPDPLLNTVEVHANPVSLSNDITDSDGCEVDLVCLDVTKEADTEISKVGDTVNYEICVINCDLTTTMENITVVDSILGDLSDHFADTLPPDTSECHTFPYVVQPGDPDPLRNEVEVHANPAGSARDLSATASDSVDLVHPCIDVTKTADPTEAWVGLNVDYEICVTNCSRDIALENITVVDDHLGDLSDSFADSLDPGASECHTFPRTVLGTDPDPLVNEVVVHSNPVGLTNDITDSDTATVDLIPPDITVTKTADTEISKVGDTVIYTICVENTGDVTLENITVVDDHLGDLSDSFADSLAPGAPAECHDFPYVVQPGDDVPPYHLVNEVVVHANPAGTAEDVSDTSSATVDLVHPSFVVDKQCSPDPVMVGETLTWTVTVANTGDIALEVCVQDPTAAIDDCRVIAQGGSETWTSDYVVQPGDEPEICNTADVFVSIADDLLPNEWHEQVTTCCQIPPPGGPTRTPGYWFTHPTALKAAFACLTGSETGVLPLCDDCEATANDAMAIFWRTSGSNRPTLAQHILAAQFNQCVLGTTAPGTIIQDGLDVLCNPDATSEEIGAAIVPLDDFNNSGDDLPFPAGMNFGSANPKAAKAMANAGTVPSCAAGTK